MRRLFASLTFREKKIIAILAVIFLLLWGLRLFDLLISKKPEIPIHGGKYSEITFGEAKNFNPFFATSRVEKDVSRLLFLNLADYGEKGKIQGVILKSFNLGPTQGELIFRNDIYWHDGQKVNAEDFIFTLQVFKEARALSLWQNNWKNITAKKLSDTKVVLSYPSQKINPKILCFPLLPAHLLKDKDLSKIQGFNYNLKPIGNGPFKLQEVQRLSSGEVNILLSKNESGVLKVYLQNVQFLVKPSLSSAYEQFKNVPFSGVSQIPLEFAEGIRDKKTDLHLVSLPQYTAIFYNLKKDKFKDIEVRKVLDMAIDRDKILEQTFLVKPTFLPLPAGSKEVKAVFNPAEAKKRLSSRSLEIELSYVNSFVFQKIALMIAEFWEQAGLKVNLVPYEELMLSEKIFAGDFEAVIWSETIGRDWDLTRWYSKSDLNFSGFAMPEIDSLLPKAESKEEKIKIAELIRDQYPASFLFSVPYVWASRNLKGVSLIMQVEEPSDRFKEVVNWYIAPSK